MTIRQFWMAVYLQSLSQGTNANLCISRADSATEAVKKVSNS